MKPKYVTYNMKILLSWVRFPKQSLPPVFASPSSRIRFSE